MQSERYLDLIEVNKLEHLKPDAFTGQSLINIICSVGAIMQERGCTSVLDYGCGKGLIQSYFHVDELWGAAYCGYDPTYPKFSKKPIGKFDAVIATDVLEHIPEPDLTDWVLDEVFGYANKVVFVKVPTYLADRTLPNGENAHCTIKTREEWEKLLTDAANRHGVGLALWIKTKATK